MAQERRSKKEEGRRYRNTILLVELELLTNDLVCIRHTDCPLVHVCVNARPVVAVLIVFSRSASGAYHNSAAWVSQHQAVRYVFRLVAKQCCKAEVSRFL